MDNMTAPTQAQITAIVDKFFASIEQYAIPEQMDADRKQLIDELTAAAQVGEPDDEARLVARWDKKFKDGVKNIENRTIERCAQVADEKLKEHDGPYGCGPYTRAAIKSIATAIRKLKDEI